MIFNDPLFLLFIPLFFFCLLAFKIKGTKQNFLIISSTKAFKNNFDLKSFIVSRIHYLRIIIFVLVCIAAARPQFVIEQEKQHYGIAIMLVMDCSSTMLAEDLTLSATGVTALVDKSKKKHSNRLDNLKAIA
ncbi:MAG: hypothetical protein PHQ52_05365, partial [Candidatus Omnitrophica bacterium]|nr:hypothetical protein [Candidatus Omnitrophota bacterium]